MKLCPYPFSRLQTNHEDGSLNPESEAFYPCCPSWFSEEYYQLPKEKNLADIWNGKAAVELRKRMYQGDYSLCNRATCQMPLLEIDELSDQNVTFLETPISPENLAAIKRQDPVMPALPSSLHLTADLTCNLSCPSCRAKLIPNTKPSQEAQDEYDYVQSLKDSLEVIKMSSGGEVFYSTLQRQLLKSFNPKDFPKLKRIHIVSNGTLFNQKTYDDLAPGTSYIKDVSISIDAGSKEVYEKIRGNYWEQVLANLKWMSTMRQRGKFDFLSLNFILQKANFRDIPNLVKLGQELNVDRMLIQRYLPYADQGFKTKEEQDAQCVHLPTHPDHQEVVAILRSFKDVPKLYTLLDIPGFEDKIANDVDMKRASQLHTQARTAMEQQSWAEALELTHQSLAITPQTHSLNTLAEILTEIGMGHIKDGQLASGRELIETAYDKEVLPFPDSPRFVTTMLKNAAFAAQRQGAAALASDLFETIQGHDSLDALSWYSLSLARKSLGRAQESHEGLQRALELEPHNYFALLELGFQAQQRADFPKAIEYIAAALENAPAGHHGEALRALYNARMAHGEALKDAGDPLSALAQFKSAGKIEPVAASGAAAAAVTAAYAQYYFAQLELGYQAQLRGEFPVALDFITVAMNNEPAANQGEARRILYNAHIAFGDALRKSGDAAQALERFGIAKEFEPVDAQGGAAAGQYYSLLDLGYKIWGEDMPRALTFFTQALELATPEQSIRLKEIIASLHGQLAREDGFVKQRSGRYRDSIAAFEKALLGVAGDPDLYFSYGVSLKRTQKFAEAEELWRKVIEMRPTHYWAMMELGYLQIRSGNRPKALEFFLRAKEIAPPDRPEHCQKFILLASRESRLARGN